MKALCRGDLWRIGAMFRYRFGSHCDKLKVMAHWLSVWLLPGICWRHALTSKCTHMRAHNNHTHTATKARHACGIAFCTIKEKYKESKERKGQNIPKGKREEMKEGWKEDRFNGLVVENKQTKNKERREVQRREAEEKKVQKKKKKKRVIK